jgi:RDD family
MYAAAMIAPLFGGIGIAFWLILLFALEWLYPIVFELTPSGATPGKRSFRLKVVMDNGLPVTPAASVTRNLMRVADFLPFGYGFAIVSILLRRDYKRLGDIAAATMVVHQPRAAPRIVLKEVLPVMPAKPLTSEDQAAVIALAARAPRLTSERLDELAALAAPISGDAGRTGPAVTRRVLGVAQWALGRR